ncbi:MAG: DUF3313 family protein [Halioglobus sp.]
MKKILAILTIFLTQSAYAAHFLDPAEIASLTPHPAVTGISRHISEGVDLDRYDKRLIGSVTFYFAEKSKSKDIDADEMKTISDTMKSSLLAAASEKGKVVSAPEESAVLINIAITEINMQNKKRGLLGYTPMGLVASTAGNLAGFRVQLRDANIEGEVVDSVTGKVLLVFRTDDIGNWDEKEGLSWEDLRATLEDIMSKVVGAVGR